LLDEKSVMAKCDRKQVFQVSEHDVCWRIRIALLLMVISTLDQQCKVFPSILNNSMPAYIYCSS